MRFTKLLVAIFLASVAAGRMVVHESRSSPPSGFVSLGPAPDTDMLTLRVALTSNNVAGLEHKLASLATPGSAEFRQWLSMEEVKSFVQPSAATVTAFNAWASANGLTPTPASPNGDWVSLTLRVARANTLFAANFQRFTHPAVAGNLTRTLSVSLPAELIGHVDVVHPTVDFAGIDPRSRSGARAIRGRGAAHSTSSCDTSVPSGHMNPACLQDLYGIPTRPATQKRNSLLVTAYGGYHAEQADLSTFLEEFRPDVYPNTTFSLVTLDNGTNPQGPGEGGVEAELDIQYTVGIATGVPVQFLSVGGALDIPGFTAAGLDTIAYLDGVKNPPAVVTTSYGVGEQDVGISLATKICNGYMALGARGISVIFASGDGGPRGGADSLDVCSDNVFNNPSFPPSCPYVTSVGGTIGLSPEKAVNLTGGGFSTFFLAPAYQSAAIAGFLKTIPADFAGVFNKTGRGFPDVATQAWNLDIILNGEPILVSGTSASAPTFASIVALINDRLVAAGKPVLGFLNPFIYSRASKAFTDITIGHNSGFVCPASTVAFDAVTGWDALTGFGTPIFSKLLAAAMEY